MSSLPIVGHLADIQARPRRLWTQSLSWVLFFIGIFTYTQFSVIRHKENPEDRVIPSGTQLWQGIKASFLEPAEEDDALDPGATLRIEELIEKIKIEYTVVIVTHNMQQATRVADDTVFMLDGQIVESGPTDTIFSHPSDKRTEDYVNGRFG